MKMKSTVSQILSIAAATLGPAAEADLYGSWTDDFRKKNAERAKARVAAWKVDFSDLSDTEAELLGFGLWSNELPIRLIPLWLYKHIASGQTLTCIDGSTMVVTDAYQSHGDGYIDNDHRGGCLAWGFIPKASST